MLEAYVPIALFLAVAAGVGIALMVLGAAIAVYSTLLTTISI